MVFKRGGYLKALIVLFGVFILTSPLIGCSFQRNENIPDIQEKIGGMEFYVDQGMAPEFAYNKEPFLLPIKISNTGFYDSTGYLVVRGRESYLEIQGDEIVTSSTNKSFELSGGSTLNSAINSDYYQFTFYPLLEERLESKTASVEISLCYNYSTTLKKTVCVDTIPYISDKAPVSCRGTTQEYHGQGAPIAITQISQSTHIDSSGIVLTYVLIVQNLGNGIVLPSTNSKNDNNNYCTTGKIDGRMNIAKISHVKLGTKEASLEKKEDSDFICSGSGSNNYEDLVFDTQGIGTIICTKKFKKDAFPLPYSSVLEISLDYGYYISFVRPLDIIRRGHQSNSFRMQTMY
ncbi:MAG TPA: hypothetical protein PLX15_02345 [Candidatus Woesearchaeota archaeon]|nr:hypothetical protein [Candidatus Woesearchaeota archaeon]